MDLMSTSSRDLSIPVPRFGTARDEPANRQNDRVDRQKEIEALKKHYAAEDLQSTEVRALKTEGEQLSKLLKKAFPNDNRDTWTYADLEDAVSKSRQAWETKERLAHGKPQRLFHTLMRKFDNHSNLFQFVPSGNLYASVVVGATAMLVKASVNHSKTIEELSDALDKITEAVEIGEVQSGLMKSLAMQSAVAKLYIKIFLFLGDAATWYKSSAASKVMSSLHKNFSERFHNQLEAITNLAANVRYIASQGSQAEVRVVRLELEGLQDELQDVRLGLSGQLRTIAEYLYLTHVENVKQHQITRDDNTQQHQRTQTLLSEYKTQATLPAPQEAELDYQRLIRPYQQLSLLEVPHQSPASAEWEQRQEIMRSVTPEPPMAAAAPANTETLSSQLAPLLQPSGPLVQRTQSVQGNSFDRSLAQATNSFLSAPHSSLLYLEYLSSQAHDEPIQHLTAQLITSCTAANMPIIPSHHSLGANICSLFPDSRSQRSQRMATLILCLAHEIHSLNPDPDPTSSTAFANETLLENYSVSSATEIFSTVFEAFTSIDRSVNVSESSVAPRRLVLVIPGHPVLSDLSPFDLDIILSSLKQHVARTRAKGSFILKVLLATSMRLPGWLPKLEASEMALLRQTPAARARGRGGVGRAGIVVPEA